MKYIYNIIYFFNLIYLFIVIYFGENCTFKLSITTLIMLSNNKWYVKLCDCVKIICLCIFVAKRHYAKVHKPKELSKFHSQSDRCEIYATTLKLIDYVYYKLHICLC